MSTFPIYVLICEGPNPRRERVLAEIERVFGRPPIVVEGLSKNAPDFQTRAAPHDAALPPGVVACAHGHRVTMQAILDAGHPFALVLEDDVQILGTAKEFARAFAELKWRRWDWIQFKGPYNASWDVFTPHPDSFMLHGIQRARHLPMTTLCYGVSRDGAQKILDRLTPITCPVDHITSQCRLAHAFKGPALATCTTETPSLIWDE